MIERREPLENPAPGAEGPSDTNPLLDELRDGVVLRTTSDVLVETYYHMEDGERIRRVAFAGTPPAVRSVRTISVVEFAGRIAQSMESGLGTIELTTPEELEHRERAHDVALAFAGIRRLERELDRERGDGSGE